MEVYTVQPNGTDGFDTDILSAAPDTNEGTQDKMGIMRYAADNLQHGLIKFDISPIPTNVRVFDAWISLFVATDYANNSAILSAYRILRNWTQAGATWNKYDGTNVWGTAGALNATDIDLTIGSWGSFTTTSSEATHAEKKLHLSKWQMTKMINGVYTNYGWMLKTNEASDQDGYNWHSSNYATLIYCPKLTILYELPYHNAYRGRQRTCGNADPRIP